jgi:hypothetical protein
LRNHRGQRPGTEHWHRRHLHKHSAANHDGPPRQQRLTTGCREKMKDCFRCTWSTLCTYTSKHTCSLFSSEMGTQSWENPQAFGVCWNPVRSPGRARRRNNMGRSRNQPQCILSPLGFLSSKCPPVAVLRPDCRLSTPRRKYAGVTSASSNLATSTNCQTAEPAEPAEPASQKYRTDGNITTPASAAYRDWTMGSRGGGGKLLPIVMKLCSQGLSSL